MKSKLSFDLYSGVVLFNICEIVVYLLPIEYIFINCVHFEKAYDRVVRDEMGSVLSRFSLSKLIRALKSLCSDSRAYYVTRA